MSDVILWTPHMHSVRESRGWEVIFSTPLLDKSPQRMTLDTRSMGSGVILAAVVGKGHGWVWL